MHVRRSPIPASLLAAAFALPLVLASPAAHATEAAAAEAFKTGASAYQKGDFRNAAASFERAYRELPRAAAIYNAGLAWEASGDAPRAADAYTAALDAGDLGAQQKKDAQTRLTNLAKTLGRVDVTGPAGAAISVEHREAAKLPAKVYLTVGSHDLTTRFEGGGGSTTQQITVAAGTTLPIAVDAPKKRAPPPQALTPKREAEAPRPPPSPPPPSSNGRKLAGFVSIGGAVIASSAAIYFGVSAVSAKDEFNASGHRDQNAHDRADSLRTTANVAWVAAGVLAAAGVVLVLTAPKQSSEGGRVGASGDGGGASVTAALGPTGGVLTWRY
jgi:hypothetical protein